MDLQAFFPNMALRCIRTNQTVKAIFEERDGRIVIVGDRGVYETLEEFARKECELTVEDPWETCEFWKSWSWWKCKEMLPPLSLRK